MTLKLGNITTVVISPPDIAKEALHKHDQALSSRTIPNCVFVHNHHKLSIVWLPAKDQWINLRKISATQLFTSQRLDARRDLRLEKVQELQNYVDENCKTSQIIDIGQAAFTTVLNLISNTFFSIDLADYSSESSQEFNKLVMDIMDQAGRPNIADYFPILSLIDPQGARRQMNIYFERLHQFFSGIMSKRMQVSASSSRTSEAEASHDVLDSLLVLVKESNSGLSLEDVKHMLFDFFVAGTDTTASTLEWAMAELLKNPEKLAKLKSEVQQVEGVIQESDII